MTGAASKAPEFLPHDVRRWVYRRVRSAAYAGLVAGRTPGNARWGDVSRFVELNCIWVHIPKTGGISLSRALFNGRHGWHTPMEHYSLIFSRREFSSAFKFTFVRNPWDRLRSAWTFLQAGGFGPHVQSDAAEFRDAHLAPYRDFEAFVLDGLPKLAADGSLGLWMRPQSDFLRLRGRIVIDFVGRYERLAEDAPVVARRLGLVGTTLPHENRSDYAEPDFRAAFTSRMIDVVAKIYREDIKAFRYSFED